MHFVIFAYQYDQRHKLEALRLRDQEERELKKQGNKRYKEIAEKHYRERLLLLQRKEIEMDKADRIIIDQKKQAIADATKRQDEPVDDSKLVEAMFDFLPDNASEAPPPNAFSVSSILSNGFKHNGLN